MRLRIQKLYRPLVWIGCAIVLLYGARLCQQPAPPLPEAKSRSSLPVTVKTEKVRIEDFSIHLHALGTVTAFNTTTIRPRVSGELLSINFIEGQNVREGDLLAVIDSRLLRNQISQAQGKLQGDKAQLDYAELELQRDRQLIEKGYIALSQLQTQNAEVNRLKGVITSDMAEIESLKLQLSFTQITAPLTGRIGLKMVDRGNILNTNDPIAIITQMQPITVLFNVPQDLHATIEKKLQVNSALAVEALDREGRRILAVGQVKSADNLIDTGSGTLRIKALFENHDEALYPNQFVNIRLVLETLQEQTVIPRQAVLEGLGGSQVFKVLEDGTIHIQPVIKGPSEDDRIVIESGLSALDVVVTEGLDKLKEGSRVQDPGAAPRETRESLSPAPNP